MSSFQKHQNYLFATLIVLVIFASCIKPKSKLAEYGTVFESVMLTDTNVFRGFSLGEKLDLVQKKELEKPTESDSAYLYYEYPLDSEGSFNITYNFDETGLNEIQSDIFINNPEKSDEIFSKFKTFFDEHYGESESHQGFTVWSVRSQKFGGVKINLSDESADFAAEKAPGKISIWIYPDKE
ncbi:MAG: hypothetical protein A3F72_01965 [Bacteroidetes bacterium RIFCSPLOWO2_12_FULL_35_15]|nr:MAG: hypothetical protein A3F72_01965 [Bacteroidetes bacterium RIFCSPLOWO2_12_FULL_35_15]